MQAGLRTLSVRLGPSHVFWACILLLEAAYAGAVGLALFASSPGWRSATAAAAHAALGAVLLWRARRTDLGSSKSIYDCYMDVWKLFYLEYLLLPLLA
jgi:homogentisate phytyltransferase/homogentisate geranylgeranyltransferase